MDMMRPLHYHIRIDTDLDRFRFSGTATIRFHADRPSRHILLYGYIESPSDKNN